MIIALIAGIVVVFIALLPSMAKAVRGKERRVDTSGDSGSSFDAGSTSPSSDCGTGDGGGGCD